MARTGVIAISDDGSSVESESLLKEAMLIAKELDILVISHPEDFKITGNGIINDGEISKKLGVAGIPRAAENSVIERDIALAEKTGARLHVAHVSTKEGIELVRTAKQKGISVTCEVAPHHLLLTEKMVLKLQGNAKMKPPLRTEEDREALIGGVLDGTVDAIATDHAPHTASEKSELGSAAFGVVGMETAFPVCLKLVDDGYITLDKLVELFTSGPASVAKISSGCLAIGAPADIAIFDMTNPYEIRSSKFFSKARNTPFENWQVRGSCVYTIVNGRLCCS